MRFALLGVTLLCAGCGRLDELLLEPPTTPQQWCARRPCNFVGTLVFGEPLGTFLVFLLALLWVAAGIEFLRTRQGQSSRSWLGIALVLGGFGAALAGFSYQALGYTLKCAGREYCLLTDGFEVAYSVTQALSVSAMLVSVAHACVGKRWRNVLIAFAMLNASTYLALTFIGVLLPSRMLLSFEVLMLFGVPGIVLVAAIAGRRYSRSGGAMERSLLIAALILVLVQVAYFAYASAGLTARFWDNGRGFYFSENDVLHIGMIGWLAFVLSTLRHYLCDDGTADGRR